MSVFFFVAKLDDQKVKNNKTRKATSIKAKLIKLR